MKGTDEASRLTGRVAWLPPLLATLVCGLQLTFWQHATAASSETLTGASNEMFGLLLFAYIVRSILEFRGDGRESWLTRAAVVLGLAMTNDWRMVAFFPLFLVALVWVKGLSFFNLRFLGRMAGCGAAGLLLYLLLPLVQSQLVAVSSAALGAEPPSCGAASLLDGTESQHYYGAEEHSSSRCIQ
ncbi:membrane hypothetical protein [Verrucomicrobia bacterium]|nr:membrane hypothetical protein [Verrucomicrobiota bacterium]